MTAPNTITPFNFHGSDVRVILRNGEPWFVASDVCAALGYANTSKAVADHLDEDERMTLTTGYGHSDTSVSGLTTGETGVGKRGGARLLVIISESGLYALVMRSRKPEARKFAKWVTSEVLPAIRKTGGYGQPEQLTINQRVSRMIDQMDSVPIQLFMPLWAAINSRLMENTMPTMYGLGLGDGVGRRISH